MPEAFRLIKDRLYRDSFQSWHAYRLDALNGILRLYAPAGTHLFDSSRWSEAPYAWQTLIIPGESFVPHLWRRPDGGYGFYVDIARSVLVRDGLALWEDIHLDVLIEDGRVSEKDEEMLTTVPQNEAEHARAVREDIRHRIAAGDPIFLPGSELWSVPVGLDAPIPRSAELAVPPGQLKAVTVDLPTMAEASMWDREPGWRRGPPGWDVIDRGDLLIWSGPLPERTTNQVVYARWSPGTEVDRGIGEVSDFFGSRGVAHMEWIIGPTSHPQELGANLEARGLVRADDARMMVASLPLPAFHVNQDVEVVEVVDAAGVHDHLLIAHPDWSKERVDAEIQERLEYLALPDRRGGYVVAYLRGELVANATWKDSFDGRCVYLKGAGTRPEFRGHGIYSALTAYRCLHAVERGCQYASIIAMTETSAPILRTRGFADLGPLPRYVGRPPA